jgi:NTP pyrophosphatase (non-canonical NTP hydrolase)
MDSKKNLQELKDLVANFRDERDWKQFHNPKDLAEAISIEAGELMELFLWQDKEQIDKKMNDDPEFLEKIKDELADVFITSMNFANAIDGLDVSEAIKKKIEKNNKKYPVEKARGVATKYTEL